MKTQNERGERREEMITYIEVVVVAVAAEGVV
jgi:hypothetical protein